MSTYVAMRSLGGRSMKTITATPRQLESLIRLAQALAKMRLSEKGKVLLISVPVVVVVSNSLSFSSSAVGSESTLYLSTIMIIVRIDCSLYSDQRGRSGSDTVDESCRPDSRHRPPNRYVIS